ncbi:MAG: rod shape-determining protein MreC, partial [Acidimicrobiales bacterium]
MTTLLVLVLVSVTIITLDETGRARLLTSGAKSVASDVYSPLRRAVNGVLDPVGRLFAGAVGYGSLERENQKLRNEILALENQQAADGFSGRVYAQLQRLQAIDELPSLAALKEVFAEVTAQNVSNFAATVEIDKGGDQGVQLGDAVVGPGGLVGQV